jgi:hypothetical protein
MIISGSKKTEDRRQKTEDRRQKTEGKNICQKQEARSQNQEEQHINCRLARPGPAGRQRE